MAPTVKMTTTTMMARLREILSARAGMNRQPTKPPSSSMPVMKPFPNGVAASGKASWNCGMTLMMEMTPWS